MTNTNKALASWRHSTHRMRRLDGAICSTRGISLRSGDTYGSILAPTFVVVTAVRS